MCSTWWPAVFSVITSASAISLFVLPWARRRRTSISRSVRPAGVALTGLGRRRPGGLEDGVCRSLLDRSRAHHHAQLVPRLLGAEGAPVRAIVGHRIEGVGGGQQPGADAELSGGGSAVVPGAVEALVV